MTQMQLSITKYVNPQQFAEAAQIKTDCPRDAHECLYFHLPCSKILL